jgi:hypothetical protein
MGPTLTSITEQILILVVQVHFYKLFDNQLTQELKEKLFYSKFFKNEYLTNFFGKCSNLSTAAAGSFILFLSGRIS